MTSEVGLNSIPSATGSSAATETSPNSELGQDAFLKLLLTQMENQNPLDPSDPTEFLSQLATFSSLEQMSNISDGIDSLANLQASGLSMQNVNLVGKRVVYESDIAPVRDEEATFRLVASERADRIVVEYDDGGRRLTTELRNVSAGETELRLEDLVGDTVKIRSVKAYVGDNALESTITTQAVGQVDGVSFEGGLPKLMIGSAPQIEPAEVIQILN